MKDYKVNRDRVSPEVLTELARTKIAEFEAFDPASLAYMLPSEFVKDIEYEIEYADNNDVVAANWRTFGGSMTSETWGAGERGRGRLGLLSRNFVLDEETLYRQKNSKEDIISRDAAMLVSRAARAIAIEINVQRANGIVNGKVDLQMPGAPTRTVDFGRKPEFTTTAPKLFTDPTSNPLEYIGTLCDMYEDENNIRPEHIWIPRKIMRTILNNPQIAQIATQKQWMTHATKTAVASLFDEYELPEIKIIANPKYRKDDLTTGEVKTHELLPQDSILLTPAGGNAADPESSPLGRTLWGETLTATAEGFNLEQSGMDLPGIVAGLIESGVPVAQEVLADAVAMPVVWQPNLIIKAKVV